MNRENYLRKLRIGLESLPQEELEDILSDYEEHFDIGASKGKTEEEIAKELGNPFEVATSYMSNYKGNSDTGDYRDDWNIQSEKRRRWIPIFASLILVALSIWMLSMSYKNLFWNNSWKRSFLTFYKKDPGVNISKDGIEVKDGNSQVYVGWKGIKVKDGDSDVEIGWDGIKVKEGNKPKFNITGDWLKPSIKQQDLKAETIDIQDFFDIRDIQQINVLTPFVDIRVTEFKEKDLRVHYHGTITTNALPEYEFTKESKDTIGLKVTLDNIIGHIAKDSTLVLEIYVPETYKGSLDINSVSGDISVVKTHGYNLNISSVSGDLDLRDLDYQFLKLNTTSGDIQMNNSKGELIISTISGDTKLENPNPSANMEINTTSGDIYFSLSKHANYTVDGTTTSGDFSSKVSMDIQENSRNKFKAVIGSGKNSIKTNTVSGDVYFR